MRIRKVKKLLGQAEARLDFSGTVGAEADAIRLLIKALRGYLEDK